MTTTTTRPTRDDVDLRWARAAAWARGQSLGPHGQDVDPAECERIEALADRILEAGEDTAFDEWNAAYMSTAAAEALGHDERELGDVLRAVEDLYEALGSLGIVDGFGGCESRRVIPEALAFIRHRANCPGSFADCPLCAAVVRSDVVQRFTHS